MVPAVDPFSPCLTFVHVGCPRVCAGWPILPPLFYRSIIGGWATSSSDSWFSTGSLARGQRGDRVFRAEGVLSFRESRPWMPRPVAALHLRHRGCRPAPKQAHRHNVADYRFGRKNQVSGSPHPCSFDRACRSYLPGQHQPNMPSAGPSQSVNELFLHTLGENYLPIRPNDENLLRSNGPQQSVAPKRKGTGLDCITVYLFPVPTSQTLPS